MKFVSMPNLPEKASAVIISADAPQEVSNALHSIGIETIYAPRLDESANPVINHPDAGIVHINAENFVCAPETYQYYKNVFAGKGANLICGNASINGKYPADAAYNIALVSIYTFLNTKNIDNVLFDNIKNKPIDIKQGYAKCSICIVDENSIITEDEGITKAAIANNIDVLKISKGQVELKGFEYGFIGGSSGKIAKNLLAFAGDITKHIDYSAIREFCLQKGVEIISLGKGALTDIGSILPVYEKE